MDLDKVLRDEIEGFRTEGHKFFNGEMSMMDFKHKSGGMGVYAHRGGKEFMIRLRVPSGVITMPQFKLIYDWAKKYKLGGLHFTTRQAVQYHGISIDEVCDLMIEALDNGIYTRGAGGNFPRNVALSPLSGVDIKEAFDPTPYALETGNYFMKRITTYKLPRKLKVSFSNGEDDTAHCTVQDLGFLAVNKDGENKFKVYLGGGLGRNSRVALVYPELIDPQDVIYYVDGMVRLFINEGNYENKAKARVRYMVEKLGEENFINSYKKYVDEAKAEGGLNINCTQNVYDKAGVVIDCSDERIVEQKQQGLYSVYVHPVGGQIKTEDIEKIINSLDKFDNPEIRLSMSEGVYFRNLNGNEAKELLEVTKNIGGDNDFECSISCIGVPTCQLGICNSQETLRDVLGYLKKKNIPLDKMPTIHISGCGNSCGVHEIAQIGFEGKKKRVNDSVQECFGIFIDGSYKEKNPKLAQHCGDITKDNVKNLLYDLAEDLNKNNLSFQEYLKSKSEAFKSLIDKYSC